MKSHNVPYRCQLHLGNILCSTIVAVGLLLPGWVQADVLSSVLPGKRVVLVGTAATALASVINTGTTVATGCFIASGTVVDASFLYQTTDPATNALTGTPNTPADIPPGGTQTFLFAFTPNSAFAQTSISLIFDCANTPPAPASVANAFSLGASATPVPDIIALAATAQNDGIVHLPTTEPDTGVFSVASINVGASGMIDVTGDTGMASLPVSISVCETDPQSGTCINPAVPSGNSMRQYAANATATHSFFVDPSDTIPLDPANNRAFANFLGVGNAAEGVTSVAMEGGAPAPINPGMPWIGNWLLVNFLPIDETEFGTDDLDGIGFSAIVTETTWTEFDEGGCTVNYALSVDSSFRHVKTATSVSGCPFGNEVLPLLNETGRLIFEGNFMNEFFDLQPGDEISAFRWLRQ